MIRMMPKRTGWLLSAVVLAAAWAGNGGKIVWENDLAFARELADIQGKPMMYYFSGDS